MHVEKGPLKGYYVVMSKMQSKLQGPATRLLKNGHCFFPNSANLTNNLLLITICVLFIASSPMCDMSVLESNACKITFKTFQEVILTTQKAVTSFSHL